MKKVTKVTKVTVTPYGMNHFKGSLTLTEGKTYDFPRITDDKGKILNLNSHKDAWKEEFIFLEDSFPESFWVKSDSTFLLEAFKNEVENKLSLPYNSKFSEFRHIHDYSGLIFSGNFSNGLKGKTFALSNMGRGTALVYNLPSQWNEALEAVKTWMSIKNEIVVKLNEDYDAVVTKNEIKVGCQTISKKSFKELVDAAKELELI